MGERMRQLNLIGYNIKGEGVHCTIDIYIAGQYAISLDTGTKYEDSAEEELNKTLGRILKGLFKENIKEKDYISVIEDYGRN